MAIVLSQVLPVDFPPIRIRDNYTAEKSALAQPTTKIALPWGGAGSNLQIPVTQSLVFLTRDPLHAIMFMDNTGAASVYTWAARNSASGIVGFTATAGQDTLLEPFVQQFSSGKAYHGQNNFAFSNEGLIYLQCDAPPGNANPAISKLEVSTTSATVAATDTFTVTFFGYANKTDQLLSTVVKTGTAGAQSLAVLTVANTDLIRVVVNYQSPVAANANCAISVVHTKSCATLCVQPLPGLSLTKASTVSSIRILGASVKISNETADQFKTGSVVGVQMHQGDNYLRILNAGAANTTPYDFLNGQRGSDEKPFNKGYYGFLKYGEEADAAYINPFTFDSANIAVNGNSPCQPLAGFLAIGISATDSSGNGRGQVTMTFNFNVEYLTLDPWEAVGTADTIPEEHDDANQIISSMVQHYENPIHWKQIFSTIGKIARVGARALGAVPHPYAQAASQVANTVGNVAEAAAE